MRTFFSERQDKLEFVEQKVIHKAPHIHEVLELIYIQKGSVELGIGQDFFHMETGSFAIVFPEIIHHYQIFDPLGAEAIFLYVPQSFWGKFMQTVQNMCPLNPVIPREMVSPDIPYALQQLSFDLKASVASEMQEKHKKSDPLEKNTLGQNSRLDILSIISYGYLQVILGRAFSKYQFTDKKIYENGDLVYLVVAYLAKHFMEHCSLTSLAKSLGYSPYTISKVFSQVFHTNFNQYLNDLRLNYAENQLEYDLEMSITDVWLNAGFDSQRTFNRVFKERFHMSPREYRNQVKKE